MKKLLLTLVIGIFCVPAMAVDFVCNSAKYRVTKFDLVQAYSGQPVLINRTWLSAVMLPSDHPDTVAAFNSFGISSNGSPLISPQAAERMAADSGLVDRGIRVVQTPAQLVAKVSTSQPAVGYSSFFTGGRDVSPCF